MDQSQPRVQMCARCQRSTLWVLLFSINYTKMPYSESCIQMCSQWEIKALVTSIFYESILCKTIYSQTVGVNSHNKKHSHLKQVNYKNYFASLHLHVADRDSFMPDICLPEFFDSTLCCSSQFNHAHLCTAVIHTPQQCKSKQLIVLIARTLCCH